MNWQEKFMKSGIPSELADTIIIKMVKNYRIIGGKNNYGSNI